MPWFDPLPSAAQLGHWFGPGPVPKKRLARWPQPNSVRSSARFRIPFTDSPGDAIASRYYLTYQAWFALTPPTPPAPDPPDIEGACWFDLEWKGGYRFVGSLGRDVNNVSLDFSVEAMDELPVVLTPGVESVVILRKLGDGSITKAIEWQTVNGPFIANPWPMNVFWPGDGNTVTTSEEGGWPYARTFITFEYIWECFGFPDP